MAQAKSSTDPARGSAAQRELGSYQGGTKSAWRLGDGEEGIKIIVLSKLLVVKPWR